MKKKYLIKYSFLFKLYLFYFYFKINFLTKKNTYSQFGEDLIILNFFKSFKGRYVDVGCFHPIKYNNTFLLYQNGWSGINIDLNKTSIDLFNASRKKDTNIQACLSDVEKDSFIYFDSEFSALNSINEDNFKNFNLKKIKKIKVKTQIFSNLVKEKFDFLNIDCEGNDLKILKTIDFNVYTPKLICVEVSHSNKSSIYEYLGFYGYKILTIKSLSHIFFRS